MEHEKNILLPQRSQETRNRETPDKWEWIWMKRTSFNHNYWVVWQLVCYRLDSFSWIQPKTAKQNTAVCEAYTAVKLLWHN